MRLMSQEQLPTFQHEVFHYLKRASLIYLKFAPLGIQGEGVKQHGADEGDAGGLAVVDPLLGVYPKTGKFGEDVNCFECLQVVDENIGNPKAFYQLQVD